MTAVVERLQALAGAERPVLLVRAAAMTDEALMTFTRDRLEAVLEPPVGA